MSRRSIRAALLLTLVGAAILGIADARGQRRGRTADPVSDIVFPPGDPPIRFDHAEAAHRELACERCHVDASRSARADEVLLPAERTCLPCHAEQIARDNPSADRCGTCHAGFDEGARGRVVTPEPPTPRLRFSHRTHAREGMACRDCHGGIDEPGEDAARHLPTMRQCFECHGGPTPTASTECTTCHLVLPDGRMRSHYPEGWLNPPRWLHGMHHDADWLVTHRWVGADQGNLCATCHAETDCTDCHDGRVRPPRVHPNDWLTVHPQMARLDEPRCTSCHTTQTFCVECHARLGISPVAAPNVRSPRRFHPPPEVWTRGPVLHGREARRSMTTCTSCHAQRDCVACHGALGVGAGVSPHPPGFVRECGRLLRANDRACRTCHADMGRLRALCD